MNAIHRSTGLGPANTRHGVATPLLLGLAFLLALPASAQAQEDRTPPRERQGPILLDGGIVGGNSIACPGYYMGIEGQVKGPASIYGIIETYQCDEVPATSSRIGVSVRLGPADWLVRPAVRAGMEYNDDGENTPTVGASLTLGGSHGARFFFDRWSLPDGSSLVLTQIGAYISF